MAVCSIQSSGEDLDSVKVKEKNNKGPRPDEESSTSDTRSDTSR